MVAVTPVYLPRQRKVVGEEQRMSRKLNLVWHADGSKRCCAEAFKTTNPGCENWMTFDWKTLDLPADAGRY
jgi:hypothetical protein